MADTPEAIKKSIRTYMFVGGILFLGTIITVLVATIPALDVGKHGFDAMDCVLGLTIATGFTGLLHLGAAAFVAIGAYTFAILTCSIYPFQLSWSLAVLLAGLIGWLVGYSLGLPIMRLRGDYLAIVTLGFGEIVQDLLRNLDVITKGTQGINPLPGPNFSLSLTASIEPAG